MSRSNMTASIANLVDFIKQKVSSNIVESARTDRLDLTEQQIESILRIVDLSVSQAFTLSIDDIERVLNETLAS